LCAVAVEDAAKVIANTRIQRGEKLHKGWAEIVNGAVYQGAMIAVDRVMPEQHLA